LLLFPLLRIRLPPLQRDLIIHLSTDLAYSEKASFTDRLQPKLDLRFLRADLRTLPSEFISSAFVIPANALIYPVQDQIHARRVKLPEARLQVFPLPHARF
jgi:hypothetical protein